MPKKNSLLRYQIITAGDMASATLTSAITNIVFLDNIAIQMVWTGSPVGTFAVQGSVDYQPNPVGGTPINAGTWTAITISPSPAATGSAGNWLLDLNQLSFPYIRIVYTKGSGTGTLNAYISAKEV